MVVVEISNETTNSNLMSSNAHTDPNIQGGVNEKANAYSTLIKALVTMVIIRQGAKESNNSSRKRVDSTVLTLSLSQC